MSVGPRRLAAAACLLLAVGAVAIGALTLGDYGVTWDEGVQAHYGELVVAYFRSGFEDDRADGFLNLRYYGPLFEAAAALAYEGAPQHRYAVRHSAIAAMGLIALLATMAYARSFGGSWLPALSGLALITQPRFYGHVFNNSKDVPFAATFAVSMAVLASLLARPDRPWRRVVAAGVAIGMCAGTRPGGLPLLVFLLLAALSGVAWQTAPRAWPGARDVGRAGLQAAAVIGLAWVVLVAVWPYAHTDPIAHPLESIAKAAAFTDVYPVLFDGRARASSELPARYLPQFVAIATPPVVLLLALMGLVAGLREFRRRPREPGSQVAGLTVMWVLVPLLVFVVLRPNAYDGMRHFLFVLPGLAVLAGFGAERALAAAPSARSRTLLVATLLVALAWPLRDMVRLHPYQSSYFNFFTGGLGGAHGRYETDYWVSSYKEGMAWIRERAAERPGGPLHVLVAATRHSRDAAAAYAGPDVELSFTFRGEMPGALPAHYDYYLATTRWRKDKNFPRAPVVHTIGRDGAVFAVVKGH